MNFTVLRCDLLDVGFNDDLLMALYGILMMMPQTEQFHVLQRRLQCVPFALRESLKK